MLRFYLQLMYDFYIIISMKQNVKYKKNLNQKLRIFDIMLAESSSNCLLVYMLFHVFVKSNQNNDANRNHTKRKRNEQERNHSFNYYSSFLSTSNGHHFSKSCYRSNNYCNKICKGSINHHPECYF